MAASETTDIKEPQTEAEKAALKAWLHGGIADMQHLGKDDSERVIQGEFLSLLLRGRMGDLDADVADTRFRLRGAKVEGSVFIRHATILRSLYFTNGCHFTEGFDAERARFRGLSFDESRLDGELRLFEAQLDGQFNANGATFNAGQAEHAIYAQEVIATGWFMRSTVVHETTVTGTLWMQGATLSGQFSANGAIFEAGPSGQAIHAQGVTATAWFMNSTVDHQTRVTGTLWMSGATLSGPFEANGAIFAAGPSGEAIHAQGVTSTDWFMKSTEDHQTKVTGTLWMNEATLSGPFSAKGAVFEAGPSGQAIVAQGVTATYWFMDSTADHQTRVTGTLWMQGATLSGQFSAKGAVFEAGPSGQAIVAQGVTATYWFMDSTADHQTRVTGTLWMQGATLSGQFSAEGAVFDAGSSGDAIHLHKARIELGVYLRNTGSHQTLITGPLQLRSAKIGGGLYAGGGIFAGKGTPLDVEAAKIDGSLELTIDRMEGRLHAHRLTVTGWTRLGGDFQGAVNLSSASLQDLYVPDQCPAGGLDLSRAHVRVLHDTIASWQPKDGIAPAEAPIRLRGLTYDRLENPFGGKDGNGKRNWKKRLDWLRRQPTEDLEEAFNPQPWRQLALTFRRMGLDEEARRITIRRRTQYRKSGSCALHEKLWLGLLDLTGGYGYRPARTFIAALSMIALSWIVFALAASGCEEEGCFDGERFIPVIGGDARTSADEILIVEADNFNSEAYPTFDPRLYAIDVFVPLVEFGITDLWVINDQYEAGPDRRWYEPPSGVWLQWYAVIMRFVGAFLTAYLLVGMTGLLTQDEKE